MNEDPLPGRGRDSVKSTPCRGHSSHCDNFSDYHYELAERPLEAGTTANQFDHLYLDHHDLSRFLSGCSPLIGLNFDETRLRPCVLAVSLMPECSAGQWSVSVCLLHQHSED